MGTATETEAGTGTATGTATGTGTGAGRRVLLEKVATGRGVEVLHNLLTKVAMKAGVLAVQRTGAGAGLPLLTKVATGTE